MAGSGGFKHRLNRIRQKAARRRKRGRENLRRVARSFERKGQAFDPVEDPSRQALLSHSARRLVRRSKALQY